MSVLCRERQVQLLKMRRKLLQQNNCSLSFDCSKEAAVAQDDTQLADT